MKPIPFPDDDEPDIPRPWPDIDPDEDRRFVYENIGRDQSIL